MGPDTILMHRMPDGTVIMVSGWARDLTIQTPVEPIYSSQYYGAIGYMTERRELTLDLLVDQTIMDARDVSRVWRDINRPKELPVKREQLGE